MYLISNTQRLLSAAVLWWSKSKVSYVAGSWRTKLQTEMKTEKKGEGEMKESVKEKGTVRYWSRKTRCIKMDKGENCT